MFDGNTRTSFVLHAYLLLGCGDMPAVAKLMRMKGHNGLYSCRFCKIRGVRIPGARGNALYTPLDRSTHPEAGDTPRYDPAALPLRTHDEMLRQALEVDLASGTRAETLSRDYGINETPILAALPSVRLDLSFPVEFMHLVWLNLIPNLVLLYTGRYKDLDQGTGLYEFAAAVWEQIGRATAASGSTMPSAFGARVPNLAKDKTYMIAETWCIWTLHIAPVVLRGRFENDKYYHHFMELVRLLRICVQLELTDADVQEIREGFCSWVQKFEKYFYQYDPDRLSTCVTTVHGLLHIADSIERMGPVGCYWSFLMERFCSSLRPAITSRRNPYASIDRYVLDRTLIDQVRLLNNLNGRNRTFHEQKRPVTKKEYHISSYPASVLMRPQRVVPLVKADRERIARHLSVRFGANAKAFLQYVPERIETWGKVRRLDDGDTVHARGMVKLRRTDRDMSFVRYALEEDKYKNRPKRKPEFVRKEYFGQLQYIYILSLPALPKYKQPEPQTLLLACVTDCAGLSQPNSVGIRYYSGKMGTSQVIDLASIECVIGRVEDRGQVAIIDRSNEFSRVIIPEDDE
ncbi:hypothetical protein EXIGLDRAFT_641451 [Exidia glandulosa HHB12029]|uniref:Uncharacterized protein n=1 Tax=Exidia glandulosa HHB12029 TaxID=1314781 RepID=A0A165M0E7_EXIGL|nr:hypothetical protein EXIGLDRAFT_641451 [Exidia glandulosa HHB12029]